MELTDALKVNNEEEESDVDCSKSGSKSSLSDQNLDYSGHFFTEDSSWQREEFEYDEDESVHPEASELDVLHELRSPTSDHGMCKHSYQLSYELALDNMLTPFAASSQPHRPVIVSYAHHVIMEIVLTEETYVSDLTDIIEASCTESVLGQSWMVVPMSTILFCSKGYFTPLETHIDVLGINMTDIKIVFGNVREIKEFNGLILHSLKLCEYSARKVGDCFVKEAEGFKTHYSRYCNNYPNSIEMLTKLQQSSSVAHFLKICQQKLGHTLPLGAYLLKPVQRVLKYSLLLGQLEKNMTVGDNGFMEVMTAFKKMTSVSEHINEMKEKYDARGRLNLIKGLEGVDVTAAGDLVLEENLRYGGRSTVSSLRSRADRHVYVFLFTKLFLMTKKEEDIYQYKMHLEISDIQLTERLEKEPNSFQVRQVSTGNYFTLQAATHKRKEEWVKSIKMLLMESIPGLPDKARMLIMAGFQTDSEGRSPKSPRRQRHFSAPRETSSTQSKARARSRSSTTPMLLTGQLVKASLLATLQLEPFQEDSAEMTGVRAESNGAKNVTDDHSTGISPPEHHYKSTEAIDQEERKVKSPPDVAAEVDNNNESNSLIDGEHPSHHGHSSEVNCSDVENLFDQHNVNLFSQLMGDDANHDKMLSASPPLNEGDMQTLELLLKVSQESLNDSNMKYTETPELSPPLEFSSMLEEHVVTSDHQRVSEGRATKPLSFGPTVSTELQPGRHRRNITRRHTFTFQSQQERRKSSGYSHKEKEELSLKRHSSFNSASSPALGLAKAVCSEWDMQTLPTSTKESMQETQSQHTLQEQRAVLHLPPKLHYAHQLQITPSLRVEKCNKDAECERSIHVCQATPLSGNPEDEMSFDEVLQHYDTFASSTGKTARSTAIKHFGSPNLLKRPKKKKDRKRSMTVAAIDRATIAAAKQAAEADSVTFEAFKQSTKLSKVHQIAREYSRRIKDHQRKYSTASGNESGDTKESLESIQFGDSGHDVMKSTTSESEVEEAGARGQQYPRLVRTHSVTVGIHETTNPEIQKKGRLKGLVKSIVVKFGGSK